MIQGRVALDTGAYMLIRVIGGEGGLNGTRGNMETWLLHDTHRDAGKSFDQETLSQSRESN